MRLDRTFSFLLGLTKAGLGYLGPFSYAVGGNAMTKRRSSRFIESAAFPSHVHPHLHPRRTFYVAYLPIHESP